MTIIFVLTSVIITAVIAWMLHKDVIAKKVRALNGQIELQSITIGQLTLEKKKVEDDRLSLIARVSKAEAANEHAERELVAYEQLLIDHQKLHEQVGRFTASLEAK